MTYRGWLWVAVLAVLVVANARFGVAPAAALDSIDPPGSGALRVTDTDLAQAAGLFFNDSIPTIGGLEITFKQYQYGGDGADGIAFVLAVAPPPGTFPPAPASVGAIGGALGYTSGDVASGNGLPGGWLGIGLDVFGNFTSTNVNGSGCTDPPWASASLRPNEVTVRGPGHASVGYCLLSSSLEGDPDPLGPFPGVQLHGADRASSLRSFKIVIDARLEPYAYIVHMDPEGGTDYSTFVTSGSLPSFYYTTTGALVLDSTPPYVTFGWTASTGGLVDNHEITDVVVKNLDGLVLLSDTFTGAATTAPVFRLPAGGSFPCLTAGSDPAATPVPGCAVAAPGPTLTSMSITSIAVGVTTTITLFGEHLDQLKFTGPNRVAIDLGPGITIVAGSIKVAPDGKSITLKIKVEANAPLGFRDVRIVGPGEIVVTELHDPLQVDPAPTVASAGTGPDGTGPLLTSPAGVLRSQTVVIKGTGLQAATTVPSNLLVSFGGSGITVNSVGFDADTQLSVDVDVAAGASTAFRKVTVTNPDLGTFTSGAILAMQVADSSVPVGLAPSKTSGTATTPPQPTVTELTPSSGPAGFSPVSITGSKFSGTAANNFVTFAGPQGTRVLATIISATSRVLKVHVPQTATDGPVLVAVSGVQQCTADCPPGTLAPPIFTVTNPILSAAAVTGHAAAGRRGEQVSLDVTGLKFQAAPSPGAVVSFNPPDGLTVGAPTTITPTQISVPVTVDGGASLTLRDITVTNPDGGSDTLPQAFEVTLDSQTPMALTLRSVADARVIDGALQPGFPSVDSVHLTLNGDGSCSARSITPAKYLLEATFPDGPPPTLPLLTVKLTSSSRPGTATNDDCEPTFPQSEPDWSVGAVGETPVVTRQTMTDVGPDGDGVYRVWLASWDWLGSVHVEVVDNVAAPTIGASLTLPTSAVPEGPRKTAADGLTDFEKQRGVYVALNKATGELPTQGPQGHQRLDLDKRHFFVRGKGFRDDPTVGYPAKCGYDSNTGVPQDPLPTGLPVGPATMPCPSFKFGNAFAEIGIEVHDVTASFNAAGTSVFPTKSFATPPPGRPPAPMLDLATVTYDTKNCSGGASCDHTTKLGPRQWNFPTLGFSSFGTSSTYGTALVLGRAVRPYFSDRPYLHQTSPLGTFLTTPGPLGPVLAPITIVCDKTSTGADNGTIQGTEAACQVNGFPGGDVYKPGQFALDSSAMDINNDFCVELPFESDPLNLSPPCDPDADSATAPQATFQQVITHLTTHEMGHQAGANVHTSDHSDLMYMYSINWERAGHFSPQVRGLIQIHNKGQQ